MFDATVGLGMPFVYFKKGSADVATVDINIGTVINQGEMLVITNSIYGASFAVYGPPGTIWENNGNQ